MLWCDVILGLIAIGKAQILLIFASYFFSSSCTCLYTLKDFRFGNIYSYFLFRGQFYFYFVRSFFSLRYYKTNAEMKQIIFFILLFHLNFILCVLFFQWIFKYLWMCAWYRKILRAKKNILLLKWRITIRITIQYIARFPYICTQWQYFSSRIPYKADCAFFLTDFDCWNFAYVTTWHIIINLKWTTLLSNLITWRAKNLAAIFFRSECVWNDGHNAHEIYTWNLYLKYILQNSLSLIILRIRTRDEAQRRPCK